MVLLQEIAEIKQEKDNKKIPLETIREFLEERKYVLITKDKQKCQNLSRSFVTKVVITDNHVEVKFNESDDSKNRVGNNGAEGGTRTHTGKPTRF